jgi:pimeloyl-ACP methyl ester carboxylesterase
LKDMTIEEALETVRQDFRAFAQTCEQVLLVGHSMGGLLSAILASEKDEYHGVPNLRGLVLLSTPHHRGYWVNAFWDLLQMDVTDFFPGLRYLSEAKTGLPAPQFKPWWRGRIKEEAEALFALADLRLPDIHVPTWLMHSPLDLIVPYGEMMQLANAIDKPELITMVPLEKCGHQVFPTSRAQLKAMNVILEALRTTTAAVIPTPMGAVSANLKHQFDSVGTDALSVIAASHRRESTKNKS